MTKWFWGFKTGTVSSCQVVGTGSLVFVSSWQVVGTGSLVSVLFIYHIYLLIFCWKVLYFSTWFTEYALSLIFVVAHQYFIVMYSECYSGVARLGPVMLPPTTYLAIAIDSRVVLLYYLCYSQNLVFIVLPKPITEQLWVLPTSEFIDHITVQWTRFTNNSWKQAKCLWY